MDGDRTYQIMDDSKLALLALIRTALWGEEPEFDRKPNWPEVLRYAKEQTVPGLIADAVPSLPEEMRPSAQESMALYSIAIQIAQSHSLLNKKVVEIQSFLASHNIPSALFKGQGLASNYPKPTTRQCGDIDMYVGEKNFLKAMDLLEPGVEHDVTKYRHMKHFNMESDGVSIELHRIAEILPGFRSDRLFQEWTIESLESSKLYEVEIDGHKVTVPPADFNAPYIMNHAWHHFINGGIGLRQICDWSIYLHRFHHDIDKAELKRNLKRFRLENAWQTLGSIAVRYIGLPENECPLYDGSCDGRAEMVIEIIFSEGNFGKHSKSKTARPKGHFAGKFHSFRKSTSRTLRILPIAPFYVVYSWIFYFIKGMKNLFVRIK